MRIDYSLKDALSWRFIAVAVLPLLLVGFASYDYFIRETERRLKRENFSTAEALASQISFDLREPYLLIREIPRLIRHSQMAEPDYEQFLNSIVRDHTGFRSILMLDKQQQVIAVGLSGEQPERREKLLHLNLAQLPFLQEAQVSDQVLWSQAFISELTGSISLAVAYKTDTYDLVGYFNIEKLGEYFRMLSVDSPVHLALLDQQGTAVLQFPRQHNDTLVEFGNLPPVASALRNHHSTAIYQLDKTSYVGTSIKIPDMEWYVLYGQKHDILANAIWRFRVIFLCGLLAAVFFACLWARLLARKIVRPISELATSTTYFSEGDYNHPLPYGHHREIDELSEAFRRMRLAIDEREQQLWKNREYFQRLFNGITDAVFISTRLPNGKPGKYVEVNNIACQMLGYSRDELLDLTPYDINLASQEEPDDYQNVLNDISTHGRTLYKTQMLSKNGEWLPVEIGSQLFELDGKRVYFSVARDITLREKYETSIKTLVRSTVGLTGQDCLDEVTRNLCQWLDADGACISLFSDDELVSQSCCIDQQMYQEISLPLADTPYQMIQAGKYQFLAQGAAKQFPGLKQLKELSIDSFIGLPMLGHDGQIIGAVSIFSREPMSAVPHVEELLSVIASRASSECERVHYERELSYSEERLRTLLNSTAEAIVGINLEGDCIFCNPATLKILGYYSESDLIGKKFHRMVHYRDSMEGMVDDCPFVAAIQREGKIVGADETLQHNAGHSIPVEFWGHPMHREGKLVGVVVTFIDITRRRTLEKQLQHSQRMEAIGTLTGGIAHDFNNILTVITGYAGLLQSLCQDNPNLLPKANKIAEAAERGSKLTHGLLAYSRKKSGPSLAVDLNQLVLKVQDLFGKVIGERIQQHVTLCDQQLTVLADTSQLEQVLVNLATNARDAMPDGGVLTMKTTQTVIDKEFCRMHGYGEPGEYALMTVEDTGTGMSKDVQQKIFDPFYTTKDTGKGTGLGLAIAWGIVKQHKGYILVDSDPGQGTRFRIYLPLTTQKILPQQAAQAGYLPGGDETILLVEDDPLVRDSTCSILTAVGYRVISSDCADSALQVLETQEAELSMILSDVVMPGMKGTEFYQEIRKKTAVPVIFISGYTFDALREQGLVGDEVMLLNKPIQPAMLLAKIRETLDREQKSISA